MALAGPLGARGGRRGGEEERRDQRDSPGHVPPIPTREAVGFDAAGEDGAGVGMGVAVGGR